MIYAPKDYYFEALSLYDGIEKSTRRVISKADAGISKTEWANFISRARADVLLEARRMNADYVAPRREVISIPAGEEEIRLNPPRSVLRYPSSTIVLIEASRDSRYYPVSLVGKDQQWVYDSDYSGAAVFPVVARLDGDVLRPLPTPNLAQSYRITYVAVPERYEEETLSSDVPDELLPVPIQRAVPILAAITACVKDQRNHPQLEAMYLREQARIQSEINLRQTTDAEYVIYTGADQ